VSGSAAPAGGVEERGAAWCVGELRGDEEAADGERRGEQLLDGADSFRDEEALALTGATAPEVAG
jgi:hypothetical protein